FSTGDYQSSTAPGSSPGADLVRIDTDGGNPAVILDSATGLYPTTSGIALDLKDQKLFLQDFNGNLYSSNLWGDGLQALVKTGDVGQAVAVDTSRGKVFFFRSNQLYAMDLDGGNQTLVQDTSASVTYTQAAEIDEANGTLYIVGSDSNSVGAVFRFTYGDG